MTFSDLKWLLRQASKKGVKARITYHGLSMTHDKAFPETVPWHRLETFNLAAAMSVINSYAEKAGQLEEKIKHF